MSSKLQTAVKSILAGSALSLLNTGAFASAITPPDATPWTNSNNILTANSQIQTTTTSLGSKNSWTDNTSLAYSSWGHTGKWLTFDVTSANQVVDIKASVLTGDFRVAFTVWATGNAVFNGGTASNGTINPALNEPSLIIGSNPVHDFNQVGQLGSYGTQWMTDTSVVSNGGGNALETLAYANSGVAHTDTTTTDYGQVIKSGANQVATDNKFFNGAVNGSVGSNYAELIFDHLAVGNYLIFLGGADSSKTSSSTFQLTVSSVSAVPVPGAVYLFGSALAGLATFGRRHSKVQA